MANEVKPKVTIVTHSGRFHSDDVFGVATLCLVLEKDNAKNRIVEIIRTRDEDMIEKADFVVDVGFTYDPGKNRFDHHQQGGADIRENKIPYASFGLVWKKYGELVSGGKHIADEVEAKLIMPIDAKDNGIDLSTNMYPYINPYELRDITQAFRTTWKEHESELYKHFLFLVDFAKRLIMREVIQIRDREECENILKDIYENTQDKRLLILDTPYPWEEFVVSMPSILLVIYPKLADGTWGLQAARDDTESYGSRILLPENWVGKSDSELERATGVPGSVFCHNRRFMAVAKTKEAAIELAHLALKEAGKYN